MVKAPAGYIPGTVNEISPWDIISTMRNYSGLNCLEGQSGCEEVTEIGPNQDLIASVSLAFNLHAFRDPVRVTGVEEGSWNNRFELCADVRSKNELAKVPSRGRMSEKRIIMAGNV